VQGSQEGRPQGPVTPPEIGLGPIVAPGGPAAGTAGPAGPEETPAALTAARPDATIGPMAHEPGVGGTPESPSPKPPGETRLPWQMTQDEYAVLYDIPQPQLSSKEISDVVRTLDMAYPRTDSLREFLRGDVIADLKQKGVDSLDAYHVTNTSTETLRSDGIAGSSVDNVGRPSGNLRASSVYMFLDPDDILLGYPGILGAKNRINDVLHIKIPVDALVDIFWDSNFNVTYGTYSSVRYEGNVPASWIVGEYKYNAPSNEDIERNKRRAPAYYHGKEVRAAVEQGLVVPLESVQPYAGNDWADKYIKLFESSPRSESAGPSTPAAPADTASDLIAPDVLAGAEREAAATGEPAGPGRAQEGEVTPQNLPTDSVVIFKGPLYHNTDRETAEHILAGGFQIQETAGLTEAERGWAAGNLGDGVYLSPFYAENMNRWGGDSNLQALPTRPLRLYSLGSAEGSARIRIGRADELKAQGYDGIIVNDPHPQSGGFQVVVFDPSLLRTTGIVEDMDIPEPDLQGQTARLRSGSDLIAPEILAGAEREAAAQARERFVGPGEFTFEDYAGALAGTSEEALRRLARSLGTKVPGATGETLRKWIGDAIGTLTQAGAEPPPAVEGEAHPGSLTYQNFFARYGEALAHPGTPANAAWLARYTQGEGPQGVKGLYAGLVDEWHRINAWPAFYELTGQERPPAAQPPEESAAPAEPTEDELREQIAQEETAQVVQAVREFFGEAAPPDLPAAPPAGASGPSPSLPGPAGPWELVLARQVLDRLGIYHDEDTGRPLANRDLWRLWSAFQLPHDRALWFPQYAPVREVQVQRQRNFRVLVQALVEKSKAYFDLTDGERRGVDELLVAIDTDPGNGKLHAQLQAALTDRQRAGAEAFRQTLDDVAELYVAKMQALAVRPDWIEQFRARIGNYVPHTWYGGWVIVVQDPATKRTLYKSQVPGIQRKIETERLRAEFPGARIVGPIKATKMPSEAYQESTYPAVTAMIDLIMARVNARAGGIAGITPEQEDLIRQTAADWWKEKGFGAHFIQRQEVPGWTGDLRRPFAEYLQGVAGSLTKMEAALGFPEALAEIDPRRTPNLFARAVEDTKYWLGDDRDWGRTIPLIYANYLWGRVSSAVANTTQNLVLGWPVLSKHTRWSLAKLLTAMADVAGDTLDERETAYLARKEAQGFLEPRLSQEIGARGGNAAARAIRTPLEKVGSALDFMQRAERFNRRSMYIACLRAGLADPAAEPGADPADALVEEAHFEYGKGNRPPVARGLLKPLTLFKTWNLNYLTWEKNQIKQGEVGALARSRIAAWSLIGLGGGALLGPALYKIWPWIFGTNPEEEMEKLAGQIAAKILFRGVPSLANVSLRGSLGQEDLFPIPDPGQSWEEFLPRWAGGITADLPARVGRLGQDLANRQYARALEDAVPEFARSPLAAWRLYHQGATTRSGRPIGNIESVLDLEADQRLKLTETEALLKSLGFQPDRLARERDRETMVRIIAQDQTQRKTRWADRLYLALKSGDADSAREVLTEIADHNARLRARGQGHLAVETRDMRTLLRNRAKPVNEIPARLLNVYWDIWGKEPAAGPGKPVPVK
jgi:hypothetical protein